VQTGPGVRIPPAPLSQDPPGRRKAARGFESHPAARFPLPSRMRMADDGDRTLSREIRTALVEHVAKADAVVEPAEAIERVSESMTFRRLTTTGLIRGGGTAGIRSAESASTTASEVPELRNNDIEDGDRHWPLCPPGHPPRSLRDLQNRWRRSRGFLFARPVRSWEASKVEILHATPTGNAQRSWAVSSSTPTNGSRLNGGSGGPVDDQVDIALSNAMGLGGHNAFVLPGRKSSLCDDILDKLL
jgi:hypothetical protein